MDRSIVNEYEAGANKLRHAVGGLSPADMASDLRQLR